MSVSFVKGRGQYNVIYVGQNTIWNCMMTGCMHCWTKLKNVHKSFTFSLVFSTQISSFFSFFQSNSSNRNKYSIHLHKNSEYNKRNGLVWIVSKSLFRVPGSWLNFSLTANLYEIRNWYCSNDFSKYAWTLLKCFAFEIREKVLNRRSKIVDRRPVTPQKNGAERKQLQYGMAAVRAFFRALV